MENTINELMQKAPKGARYLKQYKNGNIQVEVKATCDRCYNENGIFYIGVHNGVPVPSYIDNGVCYKCLGNGYVWEKQVIRTEENERKHERELERKRIKAEAQRAEWERINEENRKARELAEEKARQEEREWEERIKAERAKSQYVGAVGDKVDMNLEYTGSAHFEVPAYCRFGTELMFIHNFKTTDGNAIVWKTGKGLNLEEGQQVNVKGGIKAHSEYKGQKQTVLTRCRIK